MSRVVVALLVTAVVVYVALSAALYFGQRSILYYPTPESKPDGAQQLDLASAGETLRLWVRPQSGARALIYFGGNAEDTGANFADFSLAFPQHALYFVNYRGYGGSSGKPSERALFADALAVFDHVAREHPEIDVMGRSLGSGVATYLATQRPVRKLVLVTPYDSIRAVASHHYSIFPVAWLLSDPYDSASRAAKVSSPVLALMAEQDAVIPRANSEALVAAFKPQSIEARVIPGGHNDLDPRLYLATAAEFLAR